jgi:pimeloyl-ACP methyl ester carboxylesterase
MKLFYRRYGEGPPLIILHGLYGSSDNWMTIARKISRHFTVYLPDMRNHGFSPHNDIHNYPAMTSDLLELADELRLGKFFLAGHSMGGKTAISFALKWPDRINGLLIADISPFTDETSFPPAYDQHSKILRTILNINISEAGSRQDIEELLSGHITSSGERGLIMKNIRRSEDGKFKWKINASSIMNNLKGMIEGFSRPENDENGITGFPVIFLKGERSVYLNPADYSDILKLFPAAEFRVVKNAGHWVHADDPDAVAEALISLLK